MRYLVLAALFLAGLLYGCGSADGDPEQRVEKPDHEAQVAPSKE